MSQSSEYTDEQSNSYQQQDYQATTNPVQPYYQTNQKTLFQTYPTKIDKDITSGRDKLIPFQNVPIIKVKYPTCTKSDFHLGEPLNLICLHQKCKQKPALCVVCFQQQHQTHEVVPLKLALQISRRQKTRTQQISNNSPQILKNSLELKESLFKKIQVLSQESNQFLTNIQDQTTQLFNKMTSQIQAKSGKDKILKDINELQKNQVESQIFCNLMKTLITGIPDNQQDFNDIGDENTLTSIIKNICEQTTNQITKKKQQILQSITKFNISFKTQMSIGSIIQTNFTFSQIHKHSNNLLISNTHIKSDGDSSYLYALMDPALDPNKSYSVAFEIVSASNNWLGVGLCHEKKVQSNNYTFNYANIQHGGYLISSNGGSWSSYESNSNNTVKAFHFQQGSIILVEYNHKSKIVKFSKKGTKQTYSLKINPDQKDPLHFCVLFYYKNNEVKYLGKATNNQMSQQIKPTDPVNLNDDSYQQLSYE